MARNIIGEKARTAFVLQTLQNRVSSLRRDEYNFDDGEWKEIHKNPLFLFVLLFNREYNSPERRKLIPSIRERVEGYLWGCPAFGFPFANYQFLALRDRWGFKYSDERWCELFMPSLAEELIDLCHAYGYVLNNIHKY